ncbi:hypothetical protein [Bacillus sp. FJAT-22090]|uniref:hypothetical protein n=1 Tax=Bacillus sp. FJAT-22090 TaxID=1581038 RepID=UPI00119E9280|nr:hypothetical protein [Bacillus sp. FJAT-22090]
MKSKRILLSAITISVAFLIVFFIYNSFSSVLTVTDFTITEKGYSNDNKEAWIKGFNPIAPVGHQEEIKVIVREPMIMNLIQKDKTYFVRYTIKRNGLIFLSDIETIEDQK